MRPVDVISEALHGQTLCDDAPGCAVIHDTEAEQIAAALRRAGWRFVDADTLADACHSAEKAGAFGFHDGSGCVHDEWAADILAALDAEAAS